MPHGFSKQHIQAYLGLFLVTTLSLIAIGLYAQEATQTPDDLPEFLGNITDRNCPDFQLQPGGHTMRDICTGIVWARAQLPTYDSVGDPNPGYSWSEAVAGCSALSPAGNFRLPTVEEALTLLTVTCDAQGCRNQSPLAVTGGLDGSGDLVGPPSDDAFFGGVFWTVNDFNEPAAWREGLPSRDYKRSINLLSGEADRPVFGQEVRLNAWCIHDIAPEVFEERLVNDTRTTIYQRSCSTDADCTALTNPQIGITNPYCAPEGRCAADQSVSVAQISEPTCAPTEHLEGTSCQPFNAGSCTPPGNLIDNGSYTSLWDGNIFNGDYQCTFTGCNVGFHWNPTALRSQRCESDTIGAGCDIDVPGTGEWDGLADGTNRLWQQDWDYAYPPFTLGDISFGQGQDYENGWGLCQATSCVDEGVTTQLQIIGDGSQICGCFGTGQAGVDGEYYWDAGSGACAPRLERFTLGDPQWIPYSDSTIITCDGGTFPWMGPERTNGCSLSAPQVESCIANAQPDGAGGCECQQGFADVDGDAITGNSCTPAYTMEFFNAYVPTQDMDALTPVYTALAGDINFDWGPASPHVLVNADGFGAQLTRTATFSAGVYEVIVASDDGVRIFIDGQTVIDEWNDQGRTEFRNLVELSAGQHTIEVEYYENTFDAILEFDLLLTGHASIPDFVVGDNASSSVDVYEVFIDTISVGSTPGTLNDDYIPLSTTIGGHQVRVTTPVQLGSGEASIALRDGVTVDSIQCFRASGQQRNCNYSFEGNDPVFGYPMYSFRFQDQGSWADIDITISTPPIQL